MPGRRIAHVDLDAFFASVEQRDDPALRGKPVAVGGQTRGVVAAASYEARAFGVRSAMPVAKAKRLCPDLVCVPTRFEAYRAASDIFHEVLAGFSAVRDRVGLDEAYLDLTDAEGSAATIAADIRAAVHDALSLTCSVGIAPSRFVAKVASDFHKPDGITLVPPQRVEAFLAALPVEKFHGVGPATADRLHRRGLKTGADLQAADPVWLAETLGRTGSWLARLAVGDDDRPVGIRRERKSVGAERTFFDPLATDEDVAEALGLLARRVADYMAKKRLVARTVVVKARSPAFETVTRSRTLAAPIWTEDALVENALELLNAPEPLFPTYRLLGITATGLLAGDELVFARQLALDI